MSLLLALAAVAAATADAPPARPAAASASAVAMIRVISGTHVRFAELEKSSPRTLRTTSARSADGSVQSIRILEFQ